MTTRKDMVTAHAPHRRRDDDMMQQQQQPQQQHHQHHHHNHHNHDEQQQQQQQQQQELQVPSKASFLASASDSSTSGHSEAFPSMEEEKEEGRPLSMKRVRSTQDCTLAGLFLAQAPPPDCPPYLDGKQLPLWVGRTPVELTPDRVDELHHAQYRAWKEERSPPPTNTSNSTSSSSSSSSNNNKDRKDYARILEAAGSIFNASFVKLNPHNFSITVGITVDAMYHLQAPALACANTFLYGLSLLADNPSEQTIPIQFCKAAPVFMEEWAREAFGGGEGRQAGREEVVASLFEFCGVYPHSGLPDVLGKQVEKRVEELMGEGKNKEAKALIKRLFEAPWAQGHKVLDEDVYWKLRLLSYICKRRARLSSMVSPRLLSSPASISSSFSSSPGTGAGSSNNLTITGSSSSSSNGRPPVGGPTIVKMVVVVFPSSSGRLPFSLEGGDAAGTVECGQTFTPDELEASLSSLQAAFAEFSESFLALSKETVQWELVLTREKCVLEGACMPARRYHREVEASTNPNRLVAQADFERSREFAQWLEEEGREDADVREAQAVLVVWPGLKAPGEAYMLTCGGITPYGGETAGGRAVFMSDGPMLTGRPVWSSMWLWHEAFHIMEYIFPEAPFAEASTLQGHPCFLRDQWPDHYEGQGYEWDYYFNSYRAHILDGSVQPSLAARLSSLSDLPRTRWFDLGRRETARIIQRLAHRGDRVVLRGSGNSSSSSSSSSSSGGLAFKPAECPEGVTFVSAVNEERKAQKKTRAQAREDEGGREVENKEEEEEEEEEPALMAFWVPDPPCCVITMVQGGDRAAHEVLLENMLAGENGGSYGAPSPRQQQQHQHHDSPLSPSSPTSAGGKNGGRGGGRAPSGRWVALVEGPVSSLNTDGIVGYAKQQLQQCVEQGLCTYRATGSSRMRQQYYACLTCREFSVLQGNVGCCLSCSDKCHKGHELVLKEEGPFYCDCAIGGFSNMTCSCLGQGQGAPHEQKQQQLLMQQQQQQHSGHGHHHHQH